MPDLQLNELHPDGEQPAAGQAIDQDAGPQTASRAAISPQAAMSAARRAAALRASRAGATIAPRSLWRSHRLFVILVLLSLLPRILAAAAFRPALLTADSFLYMKGAVTGIPGNIRPSGYSYFLRLFHGLPHTLLLVTTAQHLMGIGVAVIVYGLLRYWGLPGWGACLAALPTLFDARQIALESYILPDTLFCLVIMLAVALLLTKRTPRVWQCACAALLLAYASVLRGNGIPLVVAVAVFMLVRKVGWKALTVAAVVFAVPLLGYVGLFHRQYGQYNITSSDGIFLWSRTTSFANCAIIKPPPDLVPLCPDKEKSVAVPARTPAWSVGALLSEPAPAKYLWASDVWWRHDADPGINARNNKLGLDFALDAIKAQPLDYLKVSARDVLLVFLATDRPQSQASLAFSTAPRISSLPSYYVSDLAKYAHTSGNTHAVNPYAFFMLLYQQPVYFPGIVFLLVLLTGLAGVIRNWRRWGGVQALPWVLAAISIVSPALVTQALYRYMIVAVPLACLAAGLAFSRQARNPGPAAAAGASTLGTGDAVSAPPAGVEAVTPAAADGAPEPGRAGSAREADGAAAPRSPG